MKPLGLTWGPGVVDVERPAFRLPRRCAGSLTYEQVFAIAQAKCLACKQERCTGRMVGGHSCWRSAEVKRALGVRR